jgi:glucose-1-phosphate cytidylyltransferase
MKLVILAGGLGTRISEESDTKPKPMVDIGGKPIIVHIMEHYARYGVNDFVICVGYKGYQIKEYFSNFFQHTSDFTIDLQDGSIQIDKPSKNDWRISIVDTGLDTQTGGRLKRVKRYLGETFLMTYGDGVSSVNIEEEVSFHQSHGKKATALAVKPPSRFAVLDVSQENVVKSFREKPSEEVGWINGGFFVLEPSVIDLIEGDSTIWERGPLEKLANDGELLAFKHEGFWQPVDTLRDKRFLEDVWVSNKGSWPNARMGA